MSAMNNQIPCWKTVKVEPFLSLDTTCDSAISLKLPVKQSYLYFLCCISLRPQPVGVQCSLTSSLGEFSGYLGLVPVSWATARVGVYHFSSLLSIWTISRRFSIHSSSPAIGFNSCFFFITDVPAPIRSTRHLLIFR